MMNNCDIAEDICSREVSIDTAGTSTSLLDTSWLDTVISTTISTWQESDGDTPLDILVLGVLLRDRNFVQRDPSMSVVECFSYVFTNVEKIEQDTEDISHEKIAAIQTCSQDLAAAYLRLVDKGELQVKNLFEKVQNSLASGDLSSALQTQCDVLMWRLLQKNVEGFNNSILKEVDILLRIDNIEEAYLKIVKYNLFWKGISRFSNHVSNVELASFEDLFSVRKKVFEKFLDYMDDAGGGSVHEINKDRASATIIVNIQGERGFKEGKFHVQNLESALKLAQNGGTIFLENGDHSTGSFFDVKQKSADPNKIITIIGASTNDCSIHGTIKVFASQKVIFKRIKFEVGDTPDSNDAIYILGGNIIFSSCLLEATVNTLWYLIGQESATTMLTVQHCVVDGLESCQRAVTLQGKNVSVRLEDSILKDMFSVLTVLKNVYADNVSVTLIGCDIEDVQTCVDLSSPGTRVLCRISSCNISLVLYDQDAPMDAVKVDGGDNVTADNNNLSFKHIDGKGFFIRNVAEVSLTKNCITTPNTVDRKLAVGEAIATENVEKLLVEKHHIVGFRIGVKLSQTVVVDIKQVLLESCAVGILVVKSKKHKKVNVVDSILRTVYYGVMGEDTNTVLSLKGDQFIDIPKALLLCKEMINTLKEEQCVYLLSREYTTSNQADTLEAEMNLYLATTENLPHRVAYEREDVQLVFKFSDLGFLE